MTMMRTRTSGGHCFIYVSFTASTPLLHCLLYEFFDLCHLLFCWYWVTLVKQVWKAKIPLKNIWSGTWSDSIAVSLLRNLWIGRKQWWHKELLSEPRKKATNHKRGQSCNCNNLLVFLVHRRLLNKFTLSRQMSMVVRQRKVLGSSSQKGQINYSLCG